MTSAVLDASAVLALIRNERGADKVAGHVGRAALSAVNLHEVVKELYLSGLEEPAAREIVAELRLDIRPHDVDAAFAAAALHEQTTVYGRGLGDRACLALALQLGVPALTADGAWRNVAVDGLSIEHVR